MNLIELRVLLVVFLFLWLLLLLFYEWLTSPRDSPGGLVTDSLGLEPEADMGGFRPGQVILQNQLQTKAWRRDSPLGV